MKKRKRTEKLVGLAICLLLFFLSGSLPVQAAEEAGAEEGQAAEEAGAEVWQAAEAAGVEAAATGEEQAPVRVAVPLMNDSGFVTWEDGVCSGYYVDYLQEIARYTGWTYEYIPIRTYEELDAICTSGEFDIMTGIVYGQEYDEAYFDYPGHSVGAKRYVMAVPKDSQLVPDSEYAFLRGVKVGVTGPEDELMERFKDFCFMHGIEYAENGQACEKGVSFIYLDDSNWRRSLAEGSVDGVVASDAFCSEQDMYALVTFGLDQIYFVVPNGETALLSQLDDALSKILNYNSDYHDTLYEKYFYDTLHYQVSFNQEEEAYLTKEKQWIVALPDGRAPYAFMDQDGQAQGLVCQVFRKIEERTGGAFQFTFRFYDSTLLAEEAVQKGECDIVGISGYSVATGGSSMRRSTSFFRDSLYYYKSSGSAAVPAAEEEVNTKESAAQRLVRVAEGRDPYAVMLFYTGSYYQNSYDYDLEAYPVSGGDMQFCFAYGDQMDETAVSIIDKSLIGLDSEELQNYVTRLCMSAGQELNLWEYLQRNRFYAIQLLTLVLTVICVMLLVFMISMYRKSRRINALLYRDEVTGGMSYRKWIETAPKWRKQQKKQQLLLYLNISGFKYINDSFGHRQGNEVLRSLREYLEKCVPDGLTARVYADRFVVLIPFEDREKAADRIRTQLTDFDGYARSRFPSFNIWLKVGGYVLKPEDDLQNAVNLANYAVDELEPKSENDFCFYDETMHQKVLSYKEIEKDMWDALQKGEFEAYYQPKFNLQTKELVGAEALVRWNHPTRGLLSPGTFIPVFEKNHFIVQIDFYIFTCVCRLQQERMQKGKPLLAISSNFSRLHLKNPDFPEQIREIAQRYEVPPRYLEIEITETMAMEEFDELQRAAVRMKEYGFKVSLDDFGSGYSSVQLLYKIPIDVLKFDKIFVDHGDQDPMELELEESIISISHKNGIQIICEGIETPEQEQFVREHHCNLVQGFLYARPMPKEAFEELLKGEEKEGTTC